MMLPTNLTLASGTPSAFKFALDSLSGVKRRSQRRSVTSRLTSSGMSMSPLRRPASTWAQRTCCFFAQIAHAMVALTSPSTTTQSGFSASITFSKAIIVLPTCSACVPLPISRLTSGLGMSSSWKNCSLMRTS